MTYRIYLAVLRRNILAIVLLTLVGGGSAAFVALRQPKVYQATATLLINAAAPSQAIPYLQAAVSGAGSAKSVVQQLADTYNVYLTSNAFDKTVIQALNLQTTPVVLGSHISSDLVGSTNFFRISVTDHNAAQAMRIANGVARLFIEQNLTVLQRQSADRAAQGPGSTLIAKVLAELDDASRLDAQLRARSDVAAPAVQQQLAVIDDRLHSLTATYNELTTQGSSTAVQSVNSATLTGPAEQPNVPIAPTVRKDVIYGIVGGLALGLMFAFAMEYLDYAIRTPEDVESASGQLPLAVIAMVGGRRTTPRRVLRRRTSGAPRPVAPDALPLTDTPGAEDQPVGLHTLAAPRDPVSEAFRTLRTNLAFSTVSKPASTLVVTSVQPGEGKTTVTANLAVVMAQSGKRVIVIDADLRRPNMHRIFNLSKGFGFTDVLLAQVTGKDVPAAIGQALQQSRIPNLQVITSGPLPPNPAELLSSDAMKPLMAELALRADIVIFDTPPMGALTDAVVLSTYVDGTVMVTRAGETRPNVLTKSMEALKKVGAHPIGVVLNMVQMSALRDYSSYYYYYAQADTYTRA